MYTLACAIVILVLAPASIRIVGRSLYGALMLVGVVVLILVPPAIYLLDLLDEHIAMSVSGAMLTSTSCDDRDAPTPAAGSPQ